MRLSASVRKIYHRLPERFPSFQPCWSRPLQIMRLVSLSSAVISQLNGTKSIVFYNSLSPFSRDHFEAAIQTKTSCKTTNIILYWRKGCWPFVCCLLFCLKFKVPQIWNTLYTLNSATFVAPSTPGAKLRRAPKACL